MELAPRHRVWMSGRHPGHVPFKFDGFLAKHLLIRLLFRLVFHRLLSAKTPIGRKARAQGHTAGVPLIRQKPRQLAAAGVTRAARTIGVRDGRPLLDDGRTLEVTNVIWCTGFRGSFPWIELPIFEEKGTPRHDGGVVGEVPGLYFVGLHFLYALSSSMIHGVGRDAARISDAVAARAVPTRSASAQPAATAAA
jgi:putative flavoprotein involved in K+ transport